MNETLTNNLLILGAGASIDMQYATSNEKELLDRVYIGTKYSPYPLGSDLIKSIINKKDVIHGYFLDNILAKLFGTDDLITELHGKYHAIAFCDNPTIDDKKELIDIIQSEQQNGINLLNPDENKHIFHFGGSGKSYISILALPNIIEKLKIPMPPFKKLDELHGQSMSTLAMAYNFKIPTNKFKEACQYIDLIADYFNIVSKNFHSLGYLGLLTKPVSQDGKKLSYSKDSLIKISKYFEDKTKSTQAMIEQFSKPISEVIGYLSEQEKKLENLYKNTGKLKPIKSNDNSNPKNLSHHDKLKKALNIMNTSNSWLEKYRELSFLKNTIHYENLVIYLTNQELFCNIFNYNNETRYQYNINKICKTTIEMYYLCYFVEIFQPKSIDYFMMNFSYFTKYDLLYEKPTNNSSYMPTVEKIKQYGKLFIANDIMQSNHTSLANIQRSTSLPNNWLHNFLWQLVVLAKINQKSEDEIPAFIKANLSIITFNYDITVDEILPPYLINQDNDDLITHVYGQAYFNEKNGDEITKTGYNYLLKYFFNKQTIYKYFGQAITLSTNEILDQINEHIKWIAEPKDISITQEKYRMKVLTSKNIYFLGFGFDVNNLECLGLLNNKNNLDISLFKNKKVYVSQGSPKIRDFFKTSFDIEEWHKDGDLYTATIDSFETKIIISDNKINKAFETDFYL